MLKCFFCDTEMIHGETTVKGHIRGRKVYFHHVPALICPNVLCDGEVLLGSTVDKMEVAIEEIKQGFGIVVDFPKN